MTLLEKLQAEIDAAWKNKGTYHDQIFVPSEPELLSDREKILISLTPEDEEFLGISHQTKNILAKEKDTLSHESNRGTEHRTRK